jgi:hypothetical protein
MIKRSLIRSRQSALTLLRIAIPTVEQTKIRLDQLGRNNPPVKILPLLPLLICTGGKLSPQRSSPSNAEEKH